MRKKETNNRLSKRERGRSRRKNRVYRGMIKVGIFWKMRESILCPEIGKILLAVYIFTAMF